MSKFLRLILLKINFENPSLNISESGYKLSEQQENEQRTLTINGFMYAL